MFISLVMVVDGENRHNIGLSIYCMSNKTKSMPMKTVDLEQVIVVNWICCFHSILCFYVRIKDEFKGNNNRSSMTGLGVPKMFIVYGKNNHPTMKKLNLYLFIIML